MPASTTKKALIRRYDRETLAGYVNPASFLQPDGVELLSDQGHASIVPYREIKHEPVTLPARVRNPEYSRGPVPPEMYVPQRY